MVSRSRMRNLAGIARSELVAEVPRLLVTQARQGFAVMPARWTMQVSSWTKTGRRPGEAARCRR